MYNFVIFGCLVLFLYSIFDYNNYHKQLEEKKLMDEYFESQEVFNRSKLLHSKCEMYKKELNSAYDEAFGTSELEYIYEEADILVDWKRKFFFCKLPKVQFLIEIVNEMK